MASRILGMGDVLTLIEKAEAAFDAEKGRRARAEAASPTSSPSPTSTISLSSSRAWASLQDLAGMMPGMNMGALKNAQLDEKAMLAYGGNHPVDDPL